MKRRITIRLFGIGNVRQVVYVDDATAPAMDNMWPLLNQVATGKAVYYTIDVLPIKSAIQKERKKG